LTQRNQLPDRHAIACDDECLPLVQGPHDPPLSLRSSRWVIRRLIGRHCSASAARAAIPLNNQGSPAGGLAAASGVTSSRPAIIVNQHHRARGEGGAAWRSRSMSLK
jgi:hypothetical protein